MFLIPNWWTTQSQPSKFRNKLCSRYKKNYAVITNYQWGFPARTGGFKAPSRSPAIWSQEAPPTRVTDWASHSDHFTGGLTGEVVFLLKRLAGWRRASKQSFPTCSPPRRISAGERWPGPITALFTVWSPAVGVQPRFISTWAPNASPTAAINQQQRLSPLLSLLRPQTRWMRPFWKS